jgi:hypothetical protein
MPTPCCPRSHGVDLTVSSGTGRSGSYEVTLRFSECPREPGLGRVVAGGHCSYSAFYTVPYHCTMALGPDSPPSANVSPCVCVCVYVWRPDLGMAVLGFAGFQGCSCSAGSVPHGSLSSEMPTCLCQLEKVHQEGVGVRCIEQ